MKLFKLITGGLVLAVVILFVWQNTSTFTAPIPFQLDLYVKENLTWNLSLYILLLVSGLLGLLAGSLLVLKPYFKLRRTLSQGQQKKEPSASAEKPSPQESTASQS